MRNPTEGIGKPLDLEMVGESANGVKGRISAADPETLIEVEIGLQIKEQPEASPRADASTAKSR